jgi:hypothetical protein
MKLSWFLDPVAVSDGQTADSVRSIVGDDGAFVKHDARFRGVSRLKPRVDSGVGLRCGAFQNGRSGGT